MSRDREQQITHKERLLRSFLMGAMLTFTYTLAFLVFVFLSVKVLILRHWQGVLLSAAVTLAIWGLIGLRKRLSLKHFDGDT
jgi:hypothetical protein